MAKTLRWHPEIFQMMQEISGNYFKDEAYPVDPDMYDALVALNALPFVRGTIYSCSGYGQVADTDLHHRGEHAYVMLSYRTEDPRVTDFHRDMKAISIKAKPAGKEMMAHPLGKTIVSYFAVAPADVRRLNALMGSDAERWAKIYLHRASQNLAFAERVEALAKRYGA